MKKQTVSWCGISKARDFEAIWTGGSAWDFKAVFESDRKGFRLYFITDGGLLSAITFSPSCRAQKCTATSTSEANLLLACVVVRKIPVSWCSQPPPPNAV
jgi:hypothetical protein